MKHNFCETQLDMSCLDSSNFFDMDHMSHSHRCPCTVARVYLVNINFSHSPLPPCGGTSAKDAFRFHP